MLTTKSVQLNITYKGQKKRDLSTYAMTTKQNLHLLEIKLEKNMENIYSILISRRSILQSITYKRSHIGILKKFMSKS